MGIMERKIETSSQGLGFRVAGQGIYPSLLVCFSGCFFFCSQGLFRLHTNEELCRRVWIGFARNESVAWRASG